MNNKGFALSVILYAMIIFAVAIFYLLLGVVKSRYNTNDDFIKKVQDSINDLGNPNL